MAMTETQRTTLYHQLTDAIGQDAARTLMEQLPPSGWDQVATKDDVKASEERILRDLGTRETRLKGEVLLAIAASESRQSARIDETNTRIDGTNTRLDETNVRIDGTNTRLDETNVRIDGTNTRIDETNLRIDGTNTRIDETNLRIDETNTRIDQTNVRIDETNTRIDETNTRLDETNRKLSELKDEVTTGFAGLHLVLAKHIRWIAAMLVGFAVSMAVPLTIALL